MGQKQSQILLIVKKNVTLIERDRADREIYHHLLRGVDNKHMRGYSFSFGTGAFLVLTMRRRFVIEPDAE